MDKEGSVNTRGKRRSKNTEEINTEPDIYKKCIDFEEQEAKSRDPMDDAKIYLNTCKRLKTLLSEIFKMKSCNDNENKDELQLKCRECYMLVCILKKLNRLEKVRMQAGREKLNSEKQKLENLTLQLQNLLYELDHLLSEYCKCKQYKSKDEDIELISTQQFLQLAPEDFKQKFQDVAPDDPIYVHELHLAMLEHELSQRIELYKLCESLELNKKQLSKDIVTQKEKLNALDPKYDAIVAAAKVLQQHLGLSSDEIRPEHELARFLPNQLYLLYCTLEVYKEVKDASVKIDILGNLEEVKLYNEERNSSIANNSDVEDVLEEVVEVKKRRRSGKTAAVVDKLEEKRKRLLQKHPLALMVTLVSSLKYELKITFTYRTFLRIITVESAADVPSNANINGNCARDVLNGESLLNELFAGDFGTESPNLANLYQFKEVGLCSYESLIPKMGHAYAWAQKLCGQNFLDMQNQKVDRNKQTVELESTLKAICERMKSRVALAQQLQHLEQNIISTLPDYLEYPKNAISTLTKFQSISYQSFCTDCYNAQFLVDNEFVSASDLFYFATIVRPKATLKAHIVVKNAYPSKAPIVILKISNGGDCHGGNSDEIRDIERVINIGLEDSFKNIEDAATHLLSLQLRLLCSLMDVYLETNENTSFSRNATFFHNVFGRNRRRPFRYKKIGNGIFT